MPEENETFKDWLEMERYDLFHGEYCQQILWKFKDSRIMKCPAKEVLRCIYALMDEMPDSFYALIRGVFYSEQRRENNHYEEKEVREGHQDELCDVSPLDDSMRKD